MTPRRWLGCLLAAAGFLTGCSNGGQDRIVGIQATGVIKGFVYFDRNGDGTFDAGDTIVSGVAVHVIVSGTLDTVASATSDTTGAVRFGAVPVGRVNVTVDSTTLPAGGIHLIAVSAPSILVTPGDSFPVRVTASYLQVSVAKARTLAVGTKVFVVGVALNPSTVFGDSTVHIADTLAAMLVTRVRGLVATGDSDRWLAVRATRNGQPTLDNPTVFPLSQGAATPSTSVTSAVAATAQGGALDAALVMVAHAKVLDTATVSGNLHLTVNDNSGPCVVQLDTLAGLSHAAVAGDTVGATLTVTGVLVPTGSGAWLLLPRGPVDVLGH